MQHFLKTERLGLRRFDENDLKNLMALDTDPEVMRYISNGVPVSEGQVAATLKRIIVRYDEWKVYGVWAAELKETREFIGWFSLKPLPGTDEIEVGYRLLKSCWGHGYATEGAKCLLEYGLKTLGLKKVVGITDPENEASKKVLKKIGLKFVDDRDYKSTPEMPARKVSWFERYGEQ